MGDQKEVKKLNKNQWAMLRRRGMDPKKFSFVKESYGCLYVRNIHTGQIKIINKYN